MGVGDTDIVQWTTLLIAILSFLIAILSFLLSQFSLSSRVKRLQDLEDFARRYHEEFPHGQEGEKVSPVKDAAFEYKKTLESLHPYATLGFGRILLTIVVSVLPLVVSLIFGGLFWIVVSAVWLFIVVVGIPLAYRYRLDKGVKKIDDSDLEALLGPKALQGSKGKDHPAECQPQGRQGVSALDFLTFLIFLVMVVFSRRR